MSSFVIGTRIVHKRSEASGKEHALFAIVLFVVVAVVTVACCYRCSMEELIKHIISHSTISLRLLIISFNYSENLLSTLVDMFLAHEKGNVLLDFCIVEELNMNGNSLFSDFSYSRLKD